MNPLMIGINSFLILLALSSSTHAQEKPTETDSKAYREAYELIFDTKARAKKAEQMLLANGTLSLADLSQRELSLLCKVYNELFDVEKQMLASLALWELDASSTEALIWIDNSFRNQFSTVEGPKHTLDFVEQALIEGKGYTRHLLILKARALIANKDESEDETLHVLVSDLLTEAAGEPLPTIDPTIGHRLSPAILIETDPTFLRFFSEEQRRELMQRLKDVTVHGRGQKFKLR